MLPAGTGLLEAWYGYSHTSPAQIFFFILNNNNIL
jgi:hypothetical protein